MPHKEVSFFSDIYVIHILIFGLAVLVLLQVLHFTHFSFRQSSIHLHLKNILCDINTAEG